VLEEWRKSDAEEKLANESDALPSGGIDYAVSAFRIRHGLASTFDDGGGQSERVSNDLLLYVNDNPAASDTGYIMPANLQYRGSFVHWKTKYYKLKDA